MATTRSVPVPDRRQCRRQRPGQPMIVTCLRGTLSPGGDLGLRLHDYSEEGIRLVLRAELPPGEEVEVGISRVGESKAVTVTGTVIWSGPAPDGCWAGIRLAHRLSNTQFHLLT